MAILVECPRCQYRNSVEATACKKCGFSNLRKQSGKNYWVEYRDNDKNRKRERIGPNKQAAETRLHEVLKNRAEDRYIDKDKNVRVKFDEVADWYLDLAQIKAKKSFRRDQLSVKVLKAFFSGKVVKDVTKSQVEAYRQKRLSDTSYHKHSVRPGTINREAACLRHMLNLAEEEGMIETVPFKKLKTLKENNVRNRLLSEEEYQRLIAHCPPHTARIVKMGYYTAMRQGEILHLT
jgi:integrase